MNIKSGYKFASGDYVFAKVESQVNEYKRKNPQNEVVDLGVGDVKFAPPEEISLQLIKESQRFSTCDGFMGYPPEEGLWQLRSKISQTYQAQGGCVLPEEVFITEGAKPALGNLFEICNFKKVAILAPTYPLYQELCNLHGVQTQLINGESGANILPKGNVDAVFLCSPNNPTGRVISLNGLKKYATYAKKAGAVIVIDGAYADFSKKYPCPYVFGGGKQIIEIRSYSKNLSFTGLRLGYVVIKKENPIYGAYKRYLSLRSNGVNVIMQRSAIISYENKSKMQEAERIEYYRKNATILKNTFKKCGLKCVGGVNAPYILVSVNQSGEEFFKNMLWNYGLVVTPGEAFGAKNSVRVSCLNTREITQKGAKIFKSALQNQNKK